MGKTRTDELLETRKQLEELKAEKKAAAGKIFKLEQKLSAYSREIDHLRKCQAAAKNGDDGSRRAIEQLRNDGRELRAKILTMMSESTVQSRIIETLKKERDNALVQLGKTPIEQAAAAPPAP